MTLTSLFLSLGFTRDSATFWWGKVVSVAALITSGLFDPHIAGMFDPAVLGIGPSTLHWIQFVSVIVLYLSGQMSSSHLPGTPAAPVPPTSGDSK